MNNIASNGSFGMGLEGEGRVNDSAPTCTVSPLHIQYLKGTEAMTSENTSMMASGPLSNMPLYQQAKVVSRQYDISANENSRLEKSNLESKPMPYMH